MQVGQPETEERPRIIPLAEQEVNTSIQREEKLEEAGVSETRSPLESTAAVEMTAASTSAASSEHDRKRPLETNHVPITATETEPAFVDASFSQDSLDDCKKTLDKPSTPAVVAAEPNDNRIDSVIESSESLGGLADELGDSAGANQKHATVVTASNVEEDRATESVVGDESSETDHVPRQG